MIDITKSKYNKYFLFYNMYFIQGIILAICELILPVYLIEKGFSVPLITLIIGVIVIPWSIKFFWGAIIDYYINFGRKIFIIVGGIQFASGLFAVAFIDPQDYLILFVFFLFFSMSGAVLLDVAIDAWAIELSHEDDRGKISGSMFAGQYSSRAICFVGLAFIAYEISYNLVFLISSLIIIIVTAYTLIFKEEKREIKSEKIRTIFLNEFKKKTIQFISIFLLIVFISSGILTLVIPLYMKIVFNLDIAQMGLIFAIFPIATAIGSLIGGGIADKYGRKIILFIFILLSMIFSFSLIFVSSWQSLAILFGIINFLLGGYMAVNFALMMDITNPRLGGFQFSFLTSISNTGSNIGNIISGSMVSIFGFSRVFLYSAWFLGPVLLMLYFINLKGCTSKKKNV